MNSQVLKEVRQTHHARERTITRTHSDEDRAREGQDRGCLRAPQGLIGLIVSSGQPLKAQGSLANTTSS